MEIRNNIIKKGVPLFFVLYFLVGTCVVNDFGISWDEPVQRSLIGAVNCHFVASGDATELLAGMDKYHGPVIEMVLYSAEKISGLQDSRSIYLLRHYLCFLLFFVGTIVFYLLNTKLFNSRIYGLFAVLLLLLSPRIFAESFYNSKDIPFLVFFIFCMYSLLQLYEKQNIRNAIFHGILCGLLIDIRILGMLMPIVSLALLFLDKKINWKNSSIYILTVVLVTIAFWPVLWLNPVMHFIEAFKQMSKYAWNGDVLYLGKMIKTNSLPWHYLPLWISISTPLLVLVLFVNGLFFMIKAKGEKVLNHFLLVSITFLVLPLLAVIVMHSVVYDAWRHVYFVYPFVVIIAVYGLKQLIVETQLKWMRYVLILMLVLGIAIPIRFMMVNHPHQQVYFNAFAGKDIRKNFDMDYWGLSYRKGLEYILQNDTTSKIIFCADHAPAVFNLDILKPADRKRLQWSYNCMDATYFLTNFRYHPEEFTEGKRFYSLEVEGENIMEVRKLK